MLNFIQMHLNENYKPSIGDSSHFIVFLRDPIYPFEAKIDEDNGPTTVSDYTAEMSERKRMVERIVNETCETEVEKYTSKI